MKKHILLMALIFFLLILPLTTVTLALVGDLNIDGAVNDADMTIVTNAYGSRAAATSPSPNW
ncbi:MAG: hypothetical protein RML36_09745, partial [Anaerolineae bacterium]|nr:hypothetical protein [Anaerolineae bacterium]